MVAGPLRLAKKYQFELLSQRIVSHLHQDFPATLADWDSIEDDKKATIMDDPVLMAAAIGLARSCDIPSILTIALYVLSGGTQTREALSILSPADLVSLIQGKTQMSCWLCNQGSVFAQSMRSSGDCYLALLERWQLLLEDAAETDPLSAFRRIIQNLLKEEDGSDEHYYKFCDPYYHNCREECSDRLGVIRHDLFESLSEWFK